MWTVPARPSKKEAQERLRALDDELAQLGTKINAPDERIQLKKDRLDLLRQRKL